MQKAAHDLSHSQLPVLFFTSWQIDGETMETVTDFIFLVSKITADDCMTAAMILKDFAPWKKSNDQSRQHIKKQRHHFADKGPYSQS